MAYLARNVDCWDCNQSFLFTVQEQGLGAELGFDDPKRCRSCRRSLEDSRRAFRYDTAPPLNQLSAVVAHDDMKRELSIATILRAYRTSVVRS